MAAEPWQLQLNERMNSFVESHTLGYQSPWRIYATSAIFSSGFSIIQPEYNSYNLILIGSRSITITCWRMYFHASNKHFRIHVEILCRSRWFSSTGRCSLVRIKYYFAMFTIKRHYSPFQVTWTTQNRTQGKTVDPLRLWGTYFTLLFVLIDTRKKFTSHGLRHLLFDLSLNDG
jgi:hypothetical protein